MPALFFKSVWQPECFCSPCFFFLPSATFSQRTDWTDCTDVNWSYVCGYWVCLCWFSFTVHQWKQPLQDVSKHWLSLSLTVWTQLINNSIITLHSFLFHSFCNRLICLILSCRCGQIWHWLGLIVAEKNCKGEELGLSQSFAKSRVQSDRNIYLNSLYAYYILAKLLSFCLLLFLL